MRFIFVSIFLTFIIANSSFPQDISPAWQKYFDGQFSSLNKNIGDLKSELSHHS